MGFAHQHFAEVFGVSGEIGFKAWCHTTDSTLAEVLAPGYFWGVQRTLRAGDLIWLGISPWPVPARPWTFDHAKVRRYLLMVRPIERNVISVRVVMELGSPLHGDLMFQVPDPAPVQGSEGAFTPADPIAQPEKAVRRRPASKS